MIGGQFLNIYGEHNDNPLVYNTFDQAMKNTPGATLIFHSDRGYQYTSKEFQQKIVNAGMTQSMSKVHIVLTMGRWKESGES